MLLGLTRQPPIGKFARDGFDCTSNLLGGLHFHVLAEVDVHIFASDVFIFCFVPYPTANG